MASASEFVVELIKEKYPIELEEFETSLVQKNFQETRCIKCESGNMVLRTGNFNPFYGCSHYPLCTNKEESCSACGNPIMQRCGRFKVCIDPDCDSWIPTCPKCGANMIQRKNKKDGSLFWGCRNFPDCTHTENHIEFNGSDDSHIDRDSSHVPSEPFSRRSHRTDRRQDQVSDFTNFDDDIPF